MSELLTKNRLDLGGSIFEDADNRVAKLDRLVVTRGTRVTEFHLTGGDRIDDVGNPSDVGRVGQSILEAGEGIIELDLDVIDRRRRGRGVEGGDAINEDLVGSVGPSSVRLGRETIVLTDNGVTTRSRLRSEESSGGGRGTDTNRSVVRTHNTNPFERNNNNPNRRGWGDLKIRTDQGLASPLGDFNPFCLN